MEDLRTEKRCYLADIQDAVGCPVNQREDVVKFTCTDVDMNEDGEIVTRRRLEPLCVPDSDIVVRDGLEEWFRQHPEVRQGEGDFRKIFSLWGTRHGNDDAQINAWSNANLARAITASLNPAPAQAAGGNANQDPPSRILMNALNSNDQTSIKSSVFTEFSDLRHIAFFENQQRVQVETNENLIAQHMMNHIDDIIQTIPLRVGSLFLLPAQRLAVYHATTIYPFERTVRVNTQSFNPYTNKQQLLYSTWDARLPANTISPLQFLSYGTGMGKTTMGLLCGLRIILHDATFLQHRNLGLNKVKMTSVNPYSGVVSREEPDMSKLARVLIVASPATLIGNWVATFKGMRAQILQHYNAPGITVWEPNTKGINRRTIREAAELGTPVIWFMRLTGAELTRVLTATPDFHYATMVIDEGNQNMSQSMPRVSECFGTTFVAQATLDSIVVNNTSQDPMRRVLEGDIYSMEYLERRLAQGIDERWRNEQPKKTTKNFDFLAKSHMALRFCVPPGFIRRQMTKESNYFIAEKLQIIPLRYSTRGFLNRGAGMQPLSMDAYISNLVAQAMRNQRQTDQDLQLVQQAIGQIRQAISNEHMQDVPNLIDRISATASEGARPGFDRLRDRFRELLNEEHECIVCWDSMPTSDMRIAQCCTAAYCDGCFRGMRNNTCAACRQNLGRAVAIQVNQQENAEQNIDIDINRPISEVAVDINGNRNLIPSAVFRMAVMSMLQDPNARLLVYFKRHLGEGPLPFFEELMGDVRRPPLSAQAMYLKGSSAANRSQDLEVFNRSQPGRVVMFIERGESADNVFGFDFKMATGLIMDDANMNTDKLIQLIGRVTRMRTLANPPPESIPIVVMKPR